MLFPSPLPPLAQECNASNNQRAIQLSAQNTRAAACETSKDLEDGLPNSQQNSHNRLGVVEEGRTSKGALGGGGGVSSDGC